jgi:hypothetical protein
MTAPEEIAAMVVFLLSARAAHITAQHIFLDGRLRASRPVADITMANSSPLTERRYVAPFILITSLFFLWAFGVNLNDILIPRFKNAFALSDFQSSFIQVAFFSGYGLAALPAGRLMERIGYKRGILTGLALCAAEACYSCPRRQPELVRSSSPRCLSWLAVRVRRYHEKIWPNITQSLRDSDIEDMQIYLRVTRHVHDHGCQREFFLGGPHVKLPAGHARRPVWRIVAAHGMRLPTEKMIAVHLLRCGRMNRNGPRVALKGLEQFVVAVELQMRMRKVSEGETGCCRL